MDDDIQTKMQSLMYGLTKNAAMHSYADFLKHWGITEADYAEIKRIWKEKLGVEPYV